MRRINFWRRYISLLVFALLLATVYYTLSSVHLLCRKCSTLEFGSILPLAPKCSFPPVENTTQRLPDIHDTFANYKYRNHPDCNISSLDLHAPFGPLCRTRSDFLDAFSGGGRIGFDAPFMPRGCDMRWYSTEEICEIFSRFEKVVVVGDSMMRHLVGALNVLLRRDLGYGAVTGWNFDEQESQDCFCNRQFDVKSCSIQGVFSTSSVLENDPDSLACLIPHSSSSSPPSSTNPTPQSPMDLIIEMMVRYPLDPTEVQRFRSLLSPTTPHSRKPYAFVLGHGLWNDLDLQATMNWLDGVITAIQTRAPYLSLSPSLSSSSSNAKTSHHKNADTKNQAMNVLMVTPNAAGIKKADQWIQSQGDKALQIFEASVREEARLKGVDHLGTWNMSIQMRKWDGVHLDLKGNLVKAMGVVNWLDLLWVD